MVTLDLFEPPQRERIRVEAVRLADAGLEQRQIAARLPEPATQAAVWKALALDRRMTLQFATASQVVALDARLYLPEAWTDDWECMTKVAVADTVGYQPK
jgi:hypothetical protein